MNACNQFIYCENLSVTQGQKKRGGKRKKQEEESQDLGDPLPLLIQGFEMAAKEEEWVDLAKMGMSLRQVNPAFDPRTYKHPRLQSLLKVYPKTFEFKYDESKKPPVVYVSLASQTDKLG